MATGIKTPMPPEESIAMRIVCGIMAVIAIAASFVFGESPVPTVQFDAMQGAVLVLCIWLCIGGGTFSYYYRHHQPAILMTLIKVGGALILLNLARELFIANIGSMQFQFLRPLMHALVAASVLTSFEMRTRSDIISSATFGLLLLCVAASSGKSMLFGACVFLYICLGTALLFLNCRSQTRNEADRSKRPAMVKQTTRPNIRLAPMLALAMLPVTSVAAFCLMPRLDYEADSVSAQMRTIATTTIAKMRRRAAQEADDFRKLAAKAGPNRLRAARMREAIRLANAEAAPAPAQAPAEAISEDDIKRLIKEQKPKDKSKDKSEAKSDKIPVAKKAKTGQKADYEKSKEPEESKKNSAKDDFLNSSSTKLPPPEPPKLAQSDGEPSAPQAAPLPPPNAPKIYDESRISLDQPLLNQDEPLFTLAANRLVYTKTMTMDFFDGHTWLRSQSPDKWLLEPTDKGVSFADCPPMSISFDTPIMELAQTYKMDNDLGRYVPIAGVPQTMSLLQSVEVDTMSNVQAADRLVRGTTYNVIAQLPVYSLDVMRKQPDGEPEDALAADVYLQIPRNQSKALFELSYQLVGNDGNRFTKAERILNHLRKNYSYSMQPVVSDPSDRNLVDTFLFDKKKGDCKAYATSFVMLCRAAEIPARLVIGFLPGEFDPVTGAQHVKRKHAHGWAEAYIPPYGWVPFDATPTGMLPARPEENYYNYQRLAKEVQQYTHQANATGANILTSVMTWFGYLLYAIAFGVALFALYLGARALDSLLQAIAAERKNRHPATAVKRRVLKRLRKIGVTYTTADTGHDIVSKVSECECASQLPDTVAAFMDAYNATYFGSENKLKELKSLEFEIGKMCAAKNSQ